MESNEREFMVLAIEESKRSIPENDGRVHPSVGVVIVKNHQVLEVAHRGESPRSHAEFTVLQKLKDEQLDGATIYTTLEPCTTRNHPKIPCARRLIDQKVSRVVIGMLDPNPMIRGDGIFLFREAGIKIELFPPDLMTEVENLNREFTRFHRQSVIQASMVEGHSVSIIPERNKIPAEETIALIQRARSHILLVAPTYQNWLEDSRIPALLLEKSKECVIKIVLVEESSSFPKTWQRSSGALGVEERARTLRSILTGLLEDAKRSGGGVKRLLTTDHLPFCSILIVDDDMHITHYLNHIGGEYCPTLVIDRAVASLWKKYEDEFHVLYNEAMDL